MTTDPQATLSRAAAILCVQVYYPQWSSRGMRGVACRRPAKFEALRRPWEPEPVWEPFCGVHARMYSQRRVLEPRP